MRSECEIITLADLEAAGLTAADLRRRCPDAVERVGLDGRPCWLRTDLGALLPGRGEDRP